MISLCARLNVPVLCLSFSPVIEVSNPEPALNQSAAAVCLQLGFIVDVLLKMLYCTSEMVCPYFSVDIFCSVVAQVY